MRHQPLLRKLKAELNANGDRPRIESPFDVTKNLFCRCGGELRDKGLSKARHSCSACLI
ncbi:hypothetical protein CBM2585_A160004 [Cupriavidus taiwanensis]|nr:hypothetical protein CBM2585_A160004 [Cupriavidus taiwanensis]